MSVPNGFLFDQNSGLYYKDEMTVDQNNAPIRLVTWYDPNTDTYNPVAYPVDSTQNFPQNSVTQNYQQNYADNGLQADTANQKPLKKGKGGLIAIIASSSAFVVLVVLGIVGWQMGWFNALFSSGDSAVIPENSPTPTASNATPAPTSQATPSPAPPTISPTQPFSATINIDNVEIYQYLESDYEIDILDIYIPDLLNSYPKSLPDVGVGDLMYSWEVYFGDSYAVSLYYICEEVDSTEEIDVYDMSAAFWENTSTGWTSLHFLDFWAGDNYISFYDVILPENPHLVFTEYTSLFTYIQLGTNSESRDIPVESGGYTAESSDHLGTFYSYTDNIPVLEYTPYIELYADGTYYMYLNLGDGMADGTGTYTYAPETRDGYMYFKGYDEEIYFYFEDDFDTLIFTAQSNYGLMNYEHHGTYGAFFRD